MELKINKITYTLKNLNAERRFFFVKKILSVHSKIHHKDTPEKEKSKLTIEQAQSVVDLVWMFLHPQDKKELRDASLMKIEAIDYGNFLKILSKKLEDYSAYIKTQSPNQDDRPQDINQVYAFLAKEFSWTFEFIQEMDELELLKAINEAINLKKISGISQINNNALVAAFGAGSKSAKKAIDDMNKEVKREEMLEQMKQQPAKRKTAFLTDEEMRRATSGRRS